MNHYNSSRKSPIDFFLYKCSKSFVTITATITATGQNNCYYYCYNSILWGQEALKRVPKNGRGTQFRFWEPLWVY